MRPENTAGRAERQRSRALRALVSRVARSPLATTMAIGAIAVSIYVVAYPLTVVRYPPITDLPFQGASIAILRHYFDPSWHFREQFSLQLLQVPYWTMFGLGAFFSLFMSIVWATKLATIVLLGLVPAGLSVMFHGMRKSPLLGLLGLALIWNTLTHWGFISFMGAIGLMAMVMGLTLLVVDRPTRARQVNLAIALLFVFATHIFRFPFAIAAVVGTALVMVPATRRFRPILLPLLPAVGLLVIWLLVRTKELSTQGMDPIRPHFDRMAEIPRLLFNGFLGPEEHALAFRTAWIFGAVGLACLMGLGAERRWRWWTRRDWWWVVGSHVAVGSVALVFFGMYLSMPMEIRLWWYVYPRELVAALFVALGLFPDLPRLSLLKFSLLGGVAYATASQAFLVAKNYAAFELVTEDFDRIIREIPKAPKLGYMVFDHFGSNRTTTPFIHLPAWVQATRGGWLSFHFVVWDHNPFRYREGSPSVPPATPLRFEWTPERFDIGTRGKFFDWFLVRSGVSPESRLQVDSSIKLVDHVGTWWLFHREGPASSP